jgi:TolB protein
MKFLLVFFFLSFNLLAQDELTVVAVGDAELEQEFIGIGKPRIKGELNSSFKNQVNEVMNILRNDFLYYRKLFDVKLVPQEEFNQAALRSKGIQYFVQISIDTSSGLKMEMSLYNVKLSKLLSSKVLSVNPSDLRYPSHQLADQFYRAIRGKKSIFLSKILFVSDRTSIRGDIRKELYIMDFDGGNKRQLTQHQGTVISPAISGDGSKILYSLIRNETSKTRNINLYLYDMKTGTSEMISSKHGINSGAVFMPGDKEIALTLSHEGNAEIYIMNLATKALRPVTSHFAADVDPSIAPNGSLMTFLSGRPGKAMIYTLDPTGVEKSVTRIGFVGRFNATPRFSPDSKIIAFASWMDESFDIFRLNADGSNLTRLTKDFGSNEDPDFSNDGEFLSFSSQRVITTKSAVQNIYIMDLEGEIIGSITKNYGNCITPRWSKYP